MKIQYQKCKNGVTQMFSVFPFPRKHAGMQIYRNFTERIEEAFGGHCVYFIDTAHSPVKAAKKLYSVTISTRSTGGEVLEAPG